MNPTPFESLLGTLERTAPAALEPGRFANALRALDGWKLHRINPLRFAEEHGLDAERCLELFVRAARIGLLDLEWNSICRYCGSLEHSHNSVNELSHQGCHCTVCDVEVPADLDDTVGVWFSLNPTVGPLPGDAAANLETYRRFYFAREVRASPGLREFGAWAFKGFVSCPAGGVGRLELQAEPDSLYRVINILVHSRTNLRIGSGPARDQTVRIRVSEEGLSPSEVSLAPGRVSIEIENGLNRTSPQSLLRTDHARIMEILERDPPRIEPILTAKALLNNQAFRSLFRIQSLSANLRLKVRSLTVLFTDLKGSTELYDRTGDVDAYRIVREHFGLLGQAVRAHRGAVIKTMGDAIMATFSCPLDGALAAMEMMDALGSLRVEDSGRTLGLKVGLHTGPALVVNADDRLDYFGQTVNIAARVQALSQAGEIHATEGLLSDKAAEEAFRAQGWSYDRRSVQLKGVGSPAEVLRYRRGGRQADGGNPPRA